MDRKRILSTSAVRLSLKEIIASSWGSGSVEEEDRTISTSYTSLITAHRSCPLLKIPCQWNWVGVINGFWTVVAIGGRINRHWLRIRRWRKSHQWFKGGNEFTFVYSSFPLYQSQPHFIYFFHCFYIIYLQTNQFIIFTYTKINEFKIVYNKLFL